jgi:hypothetical protein
MLGLFKRASRHEAIDTSGLGAHLVALPLPAGCTVPPACTGVIVGGRGAVRRLEGGGRMALGCGESGWCFHPGPYSADLVPFAAAPEIGLRVAFAIDSHDPRVAQQRFDLFLASEGDGPLALAALAQAIEAALRRALAQGSIELPPCTSLDEWNAFRGGFNQLLYTRFGLAVDDCVPVDLGGERDFAGLLAARAQAEPAQDSQAPRPEALQPRAFDPAAADQRALRRLFLELPCVMGRLRMAGLPPGQELFRQHQALLQRLDLACLAVGTMPALGLAAPCQPLAPARQLVRARASVRALAALDEAWALLARLERAGQAQLPQLFDEAERIVANLECALGARRIAVPEEEAA